jgi:hypothetical protein
LSVPYRALVLEALSPSNILYNSGCIDNERDFPED